MIASRRDATPATPTTCPACGSPARRLTVRTGTLVECSWCGTIVPDQPRHPEPTGPLAAPGWRHSPRTSPEGHGCPCIEPNPRPFGELLRASFCRYCGCPIEVTD